MGRLLRVRLAGRRSDVRYHALGMNIALSVLFAYGGAVIMQTELD